MDYFVRPPVNLTFVFENPIWLSNICLETQVGQQKTKGIQLFVNGDLDNCIARNFSNNPENKEIKFQNFAFPGNKIDFDKDQNKVVTYIVYTGLSIAKCHKVNQYLSKF